MRNSKQTFLGYIGSPNYPKVVYTDLPNAQPIKGELLKESGVLNEPIQQQVFVASKGVSPFALKKEKNNPLPSDSDISWITEKVAIHEWVNQLLAIAKDMNILYFNAYSLTLKIETFYLEYTTLLTNIQWIVTPIQQITPSVRLAYLALESYLHVSLEAINQFHVAFNATKKHLPLEGQKLSEIEHHVKRLQFALLQKGKESTTTFLPTIISDFQSTEKKATLFKHSQKEEQFLKDVIAIIDLHLDEEKLTVEYLSQLLYISSSQLYRKILSLTNQTATQFIRTIRLDRGKIMLENGIGNVSEVAYKVGYTPSYFSRAFSKRYGFSPKCLLKNG